MCAPPHHRSFSAPLGSCSRSRRRKRQRQQPGSEEDEEGEEEEEEVDEDRSDDNDGDGHDECRVRGMKEEVAEGSEDAYEEPDARA